MKGAARLAKIVMAFGVLAIALTLFAHAEENTTEFLGGTGTESDPFLIASASQLSNMRNHLDAHFELVADISFSDADFAEGGNFYNKGNGWVPIGDETAPFSGTLLGGQHTISGLTTKNSYRAGLWGAIDGGSIVGLHVIDANVSGKEYAGVLAGTCVNSTISDCFTSGVVVSDAEVTTRYTETREQASPSGGTYKTIYFYADSLSYAGGTEMLLRRS